MKNIHIVFVSIAMLILFSLPAVAADWEFYGSARVGSWNISDVDLHNKRRTDSDSDIFIDYDPTTHIGFSVKSGDITGVMEINPYNKTRYPVMGVSYSEMTGTLDDNGTPDDFDNTNGNETNDDYYKISTLEAPVTSGQYIETEVDIMRLCYGVWNFGMGEALVGKAYTPLNLNYSNSIFLGENNWGYGPIMEGRKPMFQLQFEKFKIAVVKADASLFRQSNRSEATQPYFVLPYQILRAGGAMIPEYTMQIMEYDGTNVDYDVDAPKIEVGYTLELGPATLDFVASYLKFTMIEYEMYNNGLSNIYSMPGLGDMVSQVRKEHDIKSWLLGAGGKFDLNPVYINLSCSIGLNPGSSESYIGPALSQAILYDKTDATYLDIGNEIADTDFYSGTLVIGCRISDTATVEAGCGAIRSKAETETLEALTVDGEYRYDQGKLKFENTTYHFYLNAMFKLAEGVYFVPEFGQQRVEYTEKQPGYEISSYNPLGVFLGTDTWVWQGGPRGVGTRYFMDDYINYAGAKLQIDF